MSQHEMGPHPEDKSRATPADRGDWRPQQSDEALGTEKDAKRSPAPGEKLHGDKLQDAVDRKTKT